MKINLNTVFKLLASLLVISLVVLFCSCGARKSEKTTKSDSSKTELTDKSEIDKSEKVESNVKISEVKTENKEEQTTTVKKTVEPIDPTKPASYVDEKGNKKELNNSKETTETKTENKKTKSEEKKDTEENTKTDKKENQKKDIKKADEAVIKEAAKKSDRKAFNPLNLLWLLVPIGIIIFLYKIRK